MAIAAKKKAVNKKPAAKKTAGKKSKIEVSPEEVLNYLRMQGKYAAAEQEVRERKLVAQAARDGGIKVSAGELQKAADGYRALMDLTKASDTQKWFTANGLTIDAFEEYLETNILKSKFMDRLEKAGSKHQKARQVRQAIRQMAYREWMSKNSK